MIKCSSSGISPDNRKNQRTCKIFAHQYIGYLKGKGREVIYVLRPLPSYQPEESPQTRSSRCAISRTVLLHDAQELDDDLGARSDQNLALSGLLGVVDAVERIVENTGSDHLCGCCRRDLRFSRRRFDLRYLSRGGVC